MATPVIYELSLRDKLSGAIDSANSRVQNFERSLGSLTTALGVTFGLAGVSMFAKNMVDAGSKVENARIGLTTLLRDSNEAGKVITQTMEDATKTPFAFEGLLQANKALISAGINSEKARADVLNLSNAIAATGGGDDELKRMVVNLQQISNTGRATALDIKQFAYAGVNIYKVLEAAGIKAGKEGDDTAITYDQITLALKKAHEAGGMYYNGLENMAGATSVQISNLGDAFFQLSVQMFDDLKPAIDWIISSMFSFIAHLKTAWNWAVRNKDMLKALATGLGAAFIAFKAMSIIPAILLSIENAMVAAATSGVTFGASMTAALGPIGLVAAAVGALAFAFDSLSSAQERNKKGEQNLRDMGKKQAEEDVEAQTKAYEKTLSHDEALRLSKEKVAKFYDEKVLEMRDRARGLDDSTEEGRNLHAREIAFGEAAAAARNYGVGKDIKPKTLAKPVGVTKMDSKTKAVGSKSITINVQIKELVHEMKVSTVTMKESASKIKELVTGALTSSINDFQIVAGE